MYVTFIQRQNNISVKWDLNKDSPNENIEKLKGQQKIFSLPNSFIM